MDSMYRHTPTRTNVEHKSAADEASATCAQSTQDVHQAEPMQAKLHEGTLQEGQEMDHGCTTDYSSQGTIDDPRSSSDTNNVAPPTEGYQNEADGEEKDTEVAVNLPRETVITSFSFQKTLKQIMNEMPSERRNRNEKYKQADDVAFFKTLFSPRRGLHHQQLTVLPVECVPLYDVNFAYEKRRYASFRDVVSTLPTWPSLLARDGYYYQNGTIRCFACGGEYPDHVVACVSRAENIPFHIFQPPSRELAENLSALGVTLAPMTDEGVVRPFNVNLRPTVRHDPIAAESRASTHHQSRPMLSASGEARGAGDLVIRQLSFAATPSLLHFARDLAECRFYAVDAQNVACCFCRVRYKVDDLLARLQQQSVSTIPHDSSCM